MLGQLIENQIENLIPFERITHHTISNY